MQPTIYLLSILRHPRKKRILACLRSASPLSFFVVPFIFGQLVSLIFGLWGLGLLTILLIYGLFCQVRLWPWPLLAGAVSVLPILVRYSPDLRADERYLVKVESQPRYRNPGGMNLSLTILGQLKFGKGDRLDLSGLRPVDVMCSAADLPWKNMYQARSGDLFIIKGKFQKVDLRSPFSYRAMLARRGYAATCKVQLALRLTTTPTGLIEQTQAKIKAQVDQAVGATELSGLIRAMSVGGHDSITPDTEESFKRVGLAHLLVVSGYQVTLVFVSVFGIMRTILIWLRRFRWHLPIYQLAALGAGLSAGAFVMLSGLDGSSLRAACAVGIAIITTVYERGRGLFNNTLLSLLIISVIWPGAVLEPGIELTFAALFGIALGDSFPSENILVRYVIVTTLATLCTALIIALWFRTLSLGALIFNPLIGNVAATISCDFGILAILGALSGIDSRLYLLKVCGLFVHSFQVLVVWLGEFDWINIELQGFSLVMVVLGLALVILNVVARAVHAFVIARVGEPRSHLLNWLLPI